MWNIYLNRKKTELNEVRWTIKRSTDKESESYKKHV